MPEHRLNNVAFMLTNDEKYRLYRMTDILKTSTSQLVRERIMYIVDHFDSDNIVDIKEYDKTHSRDVRQWRLRRNKKGG